jgi:molecular chaperone IbpA
LLNKGDKKMNATLNYAPLTRFAVGFEDLFKEMDKLNLNSSNTAYPPYNIVSLEDDRFLIEIAVAGFAEDDLDITVENGQLVITGEKVEDEPRNFVHKGIAMRNFTRSFRLATHIEVEGAKLENGLLVVTLKRHIPEELKPKKIAISQK